MTAAIVDAERLEPIDLEHPPHRRPRLIAVPVCEPPFDDERPVATTVSAPPSLPAAPRRTIAKTWTHRAGAAGTRDFAGGPATGPAQPQVRRPTTIAVAGIPTWSSESDIGVRKTATEHLPPVDRAASMLARALIEVLSGRRPLAQLRVHCAPEVYAGLADRPSAGPSALPHLLTVRVCEPADGVAEVSAAFRRADRVRAVAFRLQGVDGRWRITALQVG